MNIKIIKTRSEYDAALEKLSKLLDKNPKQGSKEDNFLELLVVVIKDYEQKCLTPSLIDPVEAILFRMEQMHLTRKDLTSCIGSPSRVSEILSGKRNLSLSMIRKLHNRFGIPLESLIQTNKAQSLSIHKNYKKDRSLYWRRKKSVRS